MKKTFTCANWKEYEGMNGTVAYCSAGAFGLTLKAEEARSCGCTTLQREKCMQAMIAATGFGLIPAIEEAEPAEAEMVNRGKLLGMIK